MSCELRWWLQVKRSKLREFLFVRKTACKPRPPPLSARRTVLALLLPHCLTSSSSFYTLLEPQTQFTPSPLPMAGYFSNHSQSRFLANSTSTAAATQAAEPQTSHPPTPGKARVPASRHFSTSLSGSGDEKTQAKEKSSGGTNGTMSVHPLRNTYVRTHKLKIRTVHSDPRPAQVGLLVPPAACTGEQDHEL